MDKIRIFFFTVLFLVTAIAIKNSTYAKPKLLLIGDSIRFYGYEKIVRDSLGESADILDFSSRYQGSYYSYDIVDYIDTIIGPSQPDIIHINFGLWDVKFVYAMEPGSKSYDSLKLIYLKNVASTLDKIKRKAPNAILIWATTTQCDEDVPFKRRNRDVTIFNNSVFDTIKSRHFILNDLYKVCSDSNLVRVDGTHFCNQDQPYGTTSNIKLSCAVIRFLKPYINGTASIKNYPLVIYNETKPQLLVNLSGRKDFDLHQKAIRINVVGEKLNLQK